MNLDQATKLRAEHASRAPGRLARWTRRPPRCRACGEVWPCARYRFARARVIQLVRQARNGSVRFR